jgi:hypothetical protein
MTDHQDHDTEAAPTEQAEPTTVLPPATHAAPELAWSVDDTAEVDSDSARRGWLVSVGLVGLVVVVAGALIFLAVTLFGSHTSKPVEATTKPSASVAAPPPPPIVTVTPPPTVTVTAAAPTTSVAPVLSATDQQFLTVLRNQGVSYPDPAYAISHAKAVCEFLAHHSGQSADDYIVRTTIWTGGLESTEFAEYSERAYCPQFAPE